MTATPTTAPKGHPRTMPAALILAYIDDTTAEPDVVAAAITDTTAEAYPPDHDPVWITPTGAAVVANPDVLALILAAATIGLEGSEDPLADEAFYAVEALTANVPT